MYRHEINKKKLQLMYTYEFLFELIASELRLHCSLGFEIKKTLKFEQRDMKRSCLFSLYYCRSRSRAHSYLFHFLAKHHRNSIDFENIFQKHIDR